MFYYSQDWTYGIIYWYVVVSWYIKKMIQYWYKLWLSEPSTVYHESFAAEKFHDKLYMQTFMKKLSRNHMWIIFVIFIFEQHHLELSYKKLLRTCKKHENVKLFCLETFMAYGILYHAIHHYIVILRGQYIDTCKSCIIPSLVKMWLHSQ